MGIENGGVVGWWVVLGGERLGKQKKQRQTHVFCFQKYWIPTKLKLFFEVQGMICKNVFVSSKTAAGEKRT